MCNYGSILRYNFLHIWNTFRNLFYNVVGYRLPNNLSIVYPDSFCPKCKHKLKWYELIPIFSFLIQGGKCRNCKCKISWFYPTIEFLTGLLFMLSYIKYGFTPECLISMLIASFFVIVIVSDMNYLIIPDEVTFFFSLVMIIIKFAFFGVKSGINSILYGLLLFAIMYLVMLLGNKVLKKECLGGGDIKIMFLRRKHLITIRRTIFFIFSKCYSTTFFDNNFIFKK